jgi:hypothetical protein
MGTLFIGIYLLPGYFPDSTMGIRERVRSLLALGLADEHDPIAEYLLTDISDKLDKEQMIKLWLEGIQ